nr:DNA-binding response regulator [uncultured Carboxylicivirga sp.]
MKTLCLVVDDEPLARQLIREHIGKIPGFDLSGECSSAMEAMAFLREEHVDLIFLDIQMPQITGLDFLRTIVKRPKVIITSAYRDYALEGFDLDVIDYLLKPITFDRFFKSISRYCQSNQPATLNEVILNDKSPQSFLYVRENKRFVKVVYDDVLYVEGFSEYVKIYTSEKRVITKLSLTWMEDQLPEDRFIRIHKSYIVALNKIDAFTAGSIEIGNKKFPIGRSFKFNVAHVLNLGVVQ